MINASDLRREHINYKESKTRIYNEILEKCMFRMKKASQKGKKFIWFKVPLFLVGSPLYDYDMCLAYQIKTLRSKDFYVRFHPPSQLYISWDENPDEDSPNIFIEEETKRTNEYLSRNNGLATQPNRLLITQSHQNDIVPRNNRILSITNYSSPPPAVPMIQYDSKPTIIKNQEHNSYSVNENNEKKSGFNNNKHNILTFLKIKQLNK